MIKQELDLSKPQKRHNLFFLAFRHFPWGMEATAIGIASLSAPFLSNLFRSHGVDSFIGGVLASGAVILVIPTLFLYLITLLRSPKIRTRAESEAEKELEILTQEMEALQEKEKKEEKQVHRLENVIDGDLKVRKEIEEKTDDRWDELTESIRLQKEAAKLAAEETIIAAKQVKEIKDKGEAALTEYTTDDVKARVEKNMTDEDHWKALDETLRLHEERNEEREKRNEEREKRSEEREKKQELREEEFLRMKQAESLLAK